MQYLLHPLQLNLNFFGVADQVCVYQVVNVTLQQARAFQYDQEVHARKISKSCSRNQLSSLIFHVGIDLFVYLIIKLPLGACFHCCADWAMS
jgi:hypothetical protein